MAHIEKSRSVDRTAGFNSILGRGAGNFSFRSISRIVCTHLT
jgi:hypothetical protein